MKSKKVHLIVSPTGMIHRGFTSKKSANTYIKAQKKDYRFGWTVKTVDLHKSIKGLI